MSRPAKWLCSFLVVLLVPALMTEWPDHMLSPTAESGSVPIVIVDHGYHAGLVVPTPALRASAMRIAREDAEQAHVLRAVAQDYPWSDWLEIGWGDAGFYQNARRLEDVTLAMAATALLVPSPSVVQVVPVWGEPEAAFHRAERIEVALSPEGFDRLVRRLAQTFAREAGQAPDATGPSLYGAGAFCAGVPDYHLFHTCNHWLSGLLSSAGVPSSWIWSATSAGLMLEISLRTEPAGSPPDS